MPAPVLAVGAFGNAINGVGAPAGAVLGAYLVAAAAGGADYEMQVSCGILTGGTPPAAATVFTMYPVVGGAPGSPGASAAAAAQTTIGAGGAAAGAATFQVASSAGIVSGNQLVGLQNAGSPFKGEVVAMASVSGTTVTLQGGKTLLNAYAAGDYVYLLDQASPVPPAAPASAAATWAAATYYSQRLALGTGRWFAAAANTSAVAVTVYLTNSDQVTAFA